LKEGSEFLKPSWGLKPGVDRSQDTKVSKVRLMRAYRQMLKAVGQEKWQQIFGGISEDQVASKILDNGRVQLTVHTGPGEDYIQFELALNADQSQWLVVSEYTDF